MKAITILMLIFFLNSSFVQKENNSFEGNWIAKDLANSTIEVVKIGKEHWKGKIIASDDKTIIGKIVFDNVKSDGKGNWIGKLTNPIKEIDVNATFHLDNENTLKLLGKKFFFTKTFYWIRKK